MEYRNLAVWIIKRPRLAISLIMNKRLCAIGHTALRLVSRDVFLNPVSIVKRQAKFTVAVWPRLGGFNNVTGLFIVILNHDSRRSVGIESGHSFGVWPKNDVSIAINRSEERRVGKECRSRW